MPVVLSGFINTGHVVLLDLRFQTVDVSSLHSVDFRLQEKSSTMVEKERNLATHPCPVEDEGRHGRHSLGGSRFGTFVHVHLEKDSLRIFGRELLEQWRNVPTGTAPGILCSKISIT